MKLKIYIDTSVIGGCFDEEFEEWSNKLINEFSVGKKIAVISDLTLKELEEAPKDVKDILTKIPMDFKEYVILTDESKYHSQKYIKERAISKKHLVEAQHIATATVSKVDVMSSWNFKHIVNLRRIRLYNSINLKYGYPMIEIRTPREVIDER